MENTPLLMTTAFLATFLMYGCAGQSGTDVKQSAGHGSDVATSQSASEVATDPQLIGMIALAEQGYASAQLNLGVM